jgi:hypothetical protein
MCTHRRLSIRKESDTEAAENWHPFIPKSVCEQEDIRILRNQGIFFSFFVMKGPRTTALRLFVQPQ